MEGYRLYKFSLIKLNQSRAQSKHMSNIKTSFEHIYAYLDINSI
jgi:hypothetical protein